MKKLIIASAIILFGVVVRAQTPVYQSTFHIGGASDSTQLPSAASMRGKEVVVNNGADAYDCVTGGGIYFVKCKSDGASWQPSDLGSGGAKFVSSQYASLSAAVSAIGSTVGELAVVTANWPDGANVTVPSTLTLVPRNAGTLNQTHTVTINGRLDCPDRQFFIGTGKTIISSAANPSIFARWWGETTVTVAGPASAPTLIAGSLSPGGNTFTNGTTYQVAYAYQAWNGLTGLSPVSSFTAKNKQGIGVKVFASMSNNSKYAVAAAVYISPDSGAHWYRGDTPFQRPGLVTFGEDTANWGGVPVDYSNGTSGDAPPTAVTTTTTKTGITVSVPAVAPTLTNLGALAAGTYYGAYAYLTGDGTETALSPVSSGLTVTEGAYVRLQRNNEPPSGAVAVRLYLGTSSTPSSLHLQTTVPLHYVTSDIHDYNSSGAAPSAGAAQSAVSAVQLAYDALMDSGAGGTIMVASSQIKTPLILRYKNSSGTVVTGVHLMGEAAHSYFFGGTAGLSYTGTQNNNVVGVMYATQGSTWQGIDVRDPNARLTAALASCDFTGGGGFNSTWTSSIFESMKAGGVGYHIPVQSASSGSHTTSEQHFDDVWMAGKAWAVDLRGGQTTDIQFVGSTFYSDGDSNSCNSGFARLNAPLWLDRFEGSGPGTGVGYNFLISGDMPHVYANGGALRMNGAIMDAIAGSATSYFHVTENIPYSTSISVTNSSLNSQFADRIALYSASPLAFTTSNSFGQGSIWANWTARNSLSSDRIISITDMGNDTFFNLASYAVKISPTSDIGSLWDKTYFTRIKIGGVMQGNAGPITTPPTITSDQYDFTPGGMTYTQRWATDAARVINGLNLSQQQRNGDEFEVWNVGTNDIIFRHDSASLTYPTPDRFYTANGGDLTLLPGNRARIVYDGVDQRWRVSVSRTEQVQLFNPQTGTSYTFLSSDNTKFVTFCNASAIAVTLPQATGAFASWWSDTGVPTGCAGTVTITPTTSTINATAIGGSSSATSVTLTTGKSFQLKASGGNYVLYNYQGRF